MASIIVPIFLVIMLTFTVTVARVLPKMNMLEQATDSYDYSDDTGKYNQKYPVASKRAALLLDRLMLALQKAVDNQAINGGRGGETDALDERPQILNPNVGIMRSGSNKNGMDLQRRGHVNGSVYWRCYFNAVTCFKKK